MGTEEHRQLKRNRWVALHVEPNSYLCGHLARVWPETECSTMKMSQREVNRKKFCNMKVVKRWKKKRLDKKWIRHLLALLPTDTALAFLRCAAGLGAAALFWISSIGWTSSKVIATAAAEWRPLKWCRVSATVKSTSTIVPWQKNSWFSRSMDCIKFNGATNKDNV